MVYSLKILNTIMPCRFINYARVLKYTFIYLKVYLKLYGAAILPLSIDLLRVSSSNHWRTPSGAVAVFRDFGAIIQVH